MPVLGKGTRRRIARSVRESNPLKNLKEMLRQSAKDQVSLKRPRRDPKSHQALSRGYKSRQALRVDLQVADRPDLEQMLVAKRRDQCWKAKNLGGYA